MKLPEDYEHGLHKIWEPKLSKLMDKADAIDIACPKLISVIYDKIFV